ncbi:6-phosphogluconate dehydrogenase [Vibrio phage 1.081.O._10N.286.52.C2]|nr:6-phosphogluconate dehydrogenase [Vibrio phage 1.081.O._10N.286.52.C2]
MSSIDLPGGNPVLPDYILEAPIDAILYGRINASWLEIPIQLDAPADGASYLRKDNTWVENIPGDSTIPPLPLDFKVYGISNGMWTAVTEEAPEDGESYVRRDTDWVVFPQSDWDVTDITQPSFIKNKPAIAQSDWDITDSLSPAYILNKPDPVLDISRDRSQLVSDYSADQTRIAVTDYTNVSTVTGNDPVVNVDPESTLLITTDVTGTITIGDVSNARVFNGDVFGIDNTQNTVDVALSVTNPAFQFSDGSQLFTVRDGELVNFFVFTIGVDNVIFPVSNYQYHTTEAILDDYLITIPTNVSSSIDYQISPTNLFTQTIAQSGTYRLAATIYWLIDETNRFYHSAMKLNGIDIGQEVKHEVKDRANVQNSSYLHRLDLVAGDVISFDYGPSGSDATVTIYAGSQVEIYRI